MNERKLERTLLTPIKPKSKKIKSRKSTPAKPRVDPLEQDNHNIYWNVVSEHNLTDEETVSTQELKIALKYGEKNNLPVNGIEHELDNRKSRGKQRAKAHAKAYRDVMSGNV